MTAWTVSVRARKGDFSLDLNLAIDGTVLAVIGPNGSGKTTLLRLLAGAFAAEHAEIVLAGRVLASTDRGIDLPIENRNVGYVPQGYGLFPHLSVLDNVAFGLSTGSRKLPRKQRRARAQQVLEGLGCTRLVDRMVAGLSGGEQQRVALARALVIDPALLLLDEPLGALDVTTRRAVRGFLADRLRSFGRPCVLVTHDVRDIVAVDATVCALEQGRIVQTGSLNELREAPASEFIAEFVGPVRPP